MDMSGDEDDTHSGDADSADHHWLLNCHGPSMTHKWTEEPLVVQEKQQRMVTFDMANSNQGSQPAGSH